MYVFFFFNDTATTEIYTLSLHDALPISRRVNAPAGPASSFTSSTIGTPSLRATSTAGESLPASTISALDRKSTRLNSSHANISYAVFCLKKKKNKNNCSDISKLHQRDST